MLRGIWKNHKFLIDVFDEIKKENSGYKLFLFGINGTTQEREMLIYSVPLIATVVGWWVNSCADKYIVTFILGISANGLLSVSYKIPQIINTIQGIFTQAWQISAIKEYGSSDTADFYGKTFIVINLMMCIVCSFLIFMTRPLAYILYANDFYEAWKYVPFLLVSSVLNCASGLLGPILSAKKNSKAMMWSAIVGAVANIIMNIVFVNLTGIQGATFATLVSSYIIYIIRKYAVGEDKAGEGALREFTEWLITEKRDVRDIKRRVDAAVNYLQSIDVSLKDIGKKIKVNDDFYYNIQYYDTKSPDLCDFESHRKYIDIQFMVSGKECLEFSDISRLSVKQSYNENLDVMFWNVPENISKIVLSEGDYIVLYPEMAHRGAVICQKSEKVLKIVGKVRI